MLFRFRAALVFKLGWNKNRKNQTLWRAVDTWNNLKPQVKAKRWWHIWGTHIFVPSLCSFQWSSLCVCFIWEVQKFIPSYNSGIVTLQLENAAIWRREMMQLVDNHWYGDSSCRSVVSPQLHSRYLNTACKTKWLPCHGECVRVCVFLFVCMSEWAPSSTWNPLKKSFKSSCERQRENLTQDSWSQSDYW